MKEADPALVGMVGSLSQSRLVLDDGSQATASFSIANEVALLFALCDKGGEPTAEMRERKARLTAFGMPYLHGGKFPKPRKALNLQGID